MGSPFFWRNLGSLRMDSPRQPGQTLVRNLDVEVERADTLRFTVLLDCRPHLALGYDAKPVWRSLGCSAVYFGHVG